jgi:hypothetical protein
MNQWTVLAACLCLGISTAQAQDDDQAPPPGGRSAEVSELEFFVGHWTTSGESRAAPDADMAPLSGEETCEWFSGGTSVICRETTTDANGTVDSIYILAYDPTRRHYTVYGTDGNGAIYSGIGTARDGSWDWDAEVRMGEAVMPMKYSFRPGEDGSRDMQVLLDAGGGRWTELVKAHYAPAE